MMASPARTLVTTTMMVISKMICTMKRLIKSLTVIAVAAMGLTACQDVFVEPTLKHEEVFINFIAEAEDTRTSVDTTGETPKFSWSANETFVVLEQTETDALAEANSVIYEKVDEKASITAAFTANAGHSEYKYVTVYPATGYVTAASIEEATLSLPANQTMAEASYDPTADLMVSRVVTTVAQPTEAQQVQFTRLAAVVKMTLKGLALEAGDSVEKVIFTAEGKALAGSITADLNKPHEFTVAEGVDNISVTTTSANDIYFTVLPTTLKAGDAYTITVITNKRLYVKQGVIPADKSLTFEAGMVNRFGVDMSTVVASEKWVLVRDASTLAEGDIVTIAASDLNYVLGCYFASNFPYASYTEVVKAGDYLYHPIITDKSKYQYMVQPLILAKSDATKAAFDLYNAVDYDGDTKSGYITNVVTNNYLRLENYPTDNTRLYITIDDKSGVATIEAKDSEFDTKLLKYRANSGGATTSNRRFGFVSTLDKEHHDVCIYKLEGVKGSVPVAGAVVTVPDADEPIAIAKEGVAEETAFEEVEFTYVGDWAIEVTTDAEWLTLNYADGSLRYTAEANEGEVRYATVTITATHDGEETQTWTFQVVQKGAPIKVTIDEFNDKAKDANVEYEVTGIMTKKGSSDSSDTTLSDGSNNANFRYVYMPDGTSFYNNEDIQVGDVVTIVASKSYSTSYGGSSTAHSTCMGYYNLKAEVENDLVAYSGGSVEITLNKVGTLSPVGDITAKSDKDFAKVTYTTNADKATVTLSANTGAPRQVVVTFTDGYAVASVTIVQSADTALGNTWELVTDASTLEVGDQLIIAAKDYDVAMSTTISSERRSAVDVTKLGNYYLTPASNAQVLVLANGSVDGTYAFYDGDNKGFLVSTSTSYKLANQTYIDANASFTISIADGIATIGNKDGDYNTNKMYYREGSSYNYFYNGTTAKQAICIYRLVGVKGSIPVVPAAVTVPTANVVVPEEGAAVATAINDVVFDYVGDWTITATSDVDWLTSLNFDKEKNYLTYTAEANEGTVRYANVTITASMEGQESLTWTFKVLQKGAPEEITCDALNDKTKNVDVTYKLTGRIVEMSSSASGTYMLDDGSGDMAKITYLYTDDGEKVYDNDNIGLALGDVVTVTTTVYSNGYGGNTNYHSTYKGHYRLTATADQDLVGYEGGIVTFDVATSGNMLPEGAVVKGAMDEAYDFVTFDYTENASTATATFAANNGASRGAEFNFTYGLASVTVSVGQYNHPDVKVGWFLVTDASELAVGDKIIIAAKSPDGTLDYAFMKPSTATTSTQKGQAIKLQGNYLSDVTGLDQFTLGNGNTDGTWSLLDDAYSRYLYAASGGYLKLTNTFSDYSDAGSWSISIDSDAKATMVSNTTSSTNTIMFNWTTTNQTFSVYKASTTGKGAIYIYKYFE